MTHALLAFLTAPGLLLMAHVLRAWRWALLFPAGILTRRFDLLLALGVGYGANLVLPLRLGEIVRAAMASRRIDNARFAYVAATVAAERTVDLAAVALIFAGAAALSGGDASRWIATAAMAATAIAGVAVATLIRRSPRARRFIWRAASIFNDRIRVVAVDFTWSFSEILLGPTVLRWRFALGTLAMWAMYLIAYLAFARYIGATFLEVLRAMLGAPLHALAANIEPGGAFERQWAPLVDFVVIPIIAITAYGGIREALSRSHAMRRLKQYGMSGVDAPAAMRERFKALATYEQYLADLFDGGAGGPRGYESEAIGDSIVHKFFNGGSDAVTALVEADGELRIRKFAVDAAAEKLATQADWLSDPRRASLPMARVISRGDGESLFRYDMPMVTPSNDFYDVIHTAPIAHSKALLARVLESLEELHRCAGGEIAEASEVDAYLDVKARRNAQVIEDFARASVTWSHFSINGAPFDVKPWRRLGDLDWLRAQISDRRVAAIHGDLTIENIIIAPDSPRGFYFIDPNPDNLFNSPLIDWAKLMQSLHLGYESLNLGASCRRNDLGLALPTLRSHNYAELHAMLEQEISNRFGEDGLREVYFHEIINYLRLTPYKIRQQPPRGLGFFVCVTILLGRYCERWGRH